MPVVLTASRSGRRSRWRASRTCWRSCSRSTGRSASTARRSRRCTPCCSPFKGLRVPARFSLLAGMTLAILAGYGAARLLERWPRQRVALAGAMLALVDRRSAADTCRSSASGTSRRPSMPASRARAASRAGGVSDAAEHLPIRLRRAVSVFLDVPLAEPRQRQQRILSAVLRRAARQRRATSRTRRR